MEKIIDPNQYANLQELNSIILGINRISAKLKTVLDAHNVHVLCLCEGIPHLHFHLIPRYCFTDKEKKFFIRNYWHQEKPNYNSYTDFKTDVISSSKNINGMWYVAFHEMNFKYSAYYKLSLKQKKQYIEKLAKLLRDDKLENPFT